MDQLLEQLRRHLSLVEFREKIGVAHAHGHVSMSSGEQRHWVASAQVYFEWLRHRQLHLIDVAPRPAFARLERRNDRMRHPMEMFGRVAARRAVATPDVAARQTETQMHPTRSGRQALFTSRRSGRNWLERDQVFTIYHHALRVSASFRALTPAKAVLFESSIDVFLGSSRTVPNCFAASWIPS
jgi:hypothetical protein